MVVFLLDDNVGPTSPWWWGQGLSGACWWCRGGISGCVGFFLVEVSWLQRAPVIGRGRAAGMVMFWV
jgi:hypothetical protein